MSSGQVWNAISCFTDASTVRYAWIGWLLSLDSGLNMDTPRVTSKITPTSHQGQSHQSSHQSSHQGFWVWFWSLCIRASGQLGMGFMAGTHQA
ncbi:hypothetical protein J1614_006436 [Plenodomus biglobosus]|nr:hypothetical protein J1614_006436 [Plenodomus biglobosus]